jgi:hypothetical protein
MPRRSNLTASSAIRQVQQQARTLMQDLRREIRAKEAELNRLREEERTLIQITGRGGAPAPGRGTAGTGRTRINWSHVLEQLPKQFKASDIRSVRGLKAKRPSEIFAAITRWIEAGSVKRKARGAYERV